MFLVLLAKVTIIIRLLWKNKSFHCKTLAKSLFWVQQEIHCSKIIKIFISKFQFCVEFVYFLDILQKLHKNEKKIDDESYVWKIIATMKWCHKTVYEVTYLMVFYVIWRIDDLYRDINFNLQIFSRNLLTSLDIARSKRKSGQLSLNATVYEKWDAKSLPYNSNCMTF